MRFLVAFFVTLAVLMVLLRVPGYLITPLAVGVGLVADEPGVKRAMFAVLTMAVAAGVVRLLS